MALLRLTTLVLVLLFFMHAFRAFSSGHTHQEIDGETLMSWSQKGIFDDVETAGSSKIGFGGRKMGAEKELKKEIMEAAGKASKISGKHNDASNVFIKRFQDQDNNQIDVKKREPEMMISVGRRDMPHARVMNMNIPSNSYIDADKRMREKKRILSVVEKELVDLLHKDYAGFNKPYRKPPINNK